MDSRHFNVFFATYRAFTNTTAVLDLLLRRFEQLEARSSGARSSSGNATMQQKYLLNVLVLHTKFCIVLARFEWFVVTKLKSLSRKIFFGIYFLIFLSIDTFAPLTF